MTSEGGRRSHHEIRIHPEKPAMQIRDTAHTGATGTIGRPTPMLVELAFEAST